MKSSFPFFVCSRGPDIHILVNAICTGARNNCKFHFRLLCSRLHADSVQLLPSERRLLPCMVRRISSESCCTCVAHLRVSLLIINAAHGERALWAMPAAPSIRIRQSLMFGLGSIVVHVGFSLSIFCLHSSFVTKRLVLLFDCASFIRWNIAFCPLASRWLYHAKCCLFRFCEDSVWLNWYEVVVKVTLRVGVELKSFVSLPICPYWCIQTGRHLNQSFSSQWSVLITMRPPIHSAHRFSERHRRIRITVDAIARVRWISQTGWVSSEVNRAGFCF